MGGAAAMLFSDGSDAESSHATSGVQRVHDGVYSSENMTEQKLVIMGKVGM